MINWIITVEAEGITHAIWLGFLGISVSYYEVVNLLFHNHFSPCCLPPGQLHDPEPFLFLPLCWQRCFSGPHAEPVFILKHCNIISKPALHINQYDCLSAATKWSITNFHWGNAKFVFLGVRSAACVFTNDDKRLGNHQVIMCIEPLWCTSLQECGVCIYGIHISHEVIALFVSVCGIVCWPLRLIILIDETALERLCNKRSKVRDDRFSCRSWFLHSAAHRRACGLYTACVKTFSSCIVVSVSFYRHWEGLIRRVLFHLSPLCVIWETCQLNVSHLK